MAQSFVSSRHLVIHSFDLVAVNEYVKVANMTAVPLPSACADILVCCLSLMNKDYERALGEAHRLLKPGGSLWIAEVSSRLGPGGLDAFKLQIEAAGFTLQASDEPNKFFILLFASKIAMPPKSSRDKRPRGAVLKPCLYKKR